MTSCRSIPFYADANTLTSFKPLPRKCWWCKYPNTIFPVGQGYSVSPVKYEGIYFFFWNKLSMPDRRTNHLEENLWGLFYTRDFWSDHATEGRGFTNFPVIWRLQIWTIFSNYWGEQTWRKNLSLRLIVIKRSQKSFHFQFSFWPWAWHIIWKVNSTNRRSARINGPTSFRGSRLPSGLR